MEQEQKNTSTQKFSYPYNDPLHKNASKLPYALYSVKRVDGTQEKLNIDQPGLHHCVFKSIMKTNTEVRSEMFSNIVLAGGNTLFEKFNQRLTNEIHLLAPPTKTDIKVFDNKERIYSSWIGGSIIGHMETFQHLCISRKDFEENGSKIVHDKTF